MAHPRGERRSPSYQPQIHLKRFEDDASGHACENGQHHLALDKGVQVRVHRLRQTVSIRRGRGCAKEQEHGEEKHERKVGDRHKKILDDVQDHSGQRQLFAQILEAGQPHRMVDALRIHP